MAKSEDITQKWWVIDASDKIVGRMATEIAVRLMGKHKPTYTPHIDTGDFVIVVNVEKVRLTGNKWDKKEYTWYTGYPGLRTEKAGKRFERKPHEILREAVRRMLPKNRLARRMLNKLKLFVGPEHTHQAQQPEPLEVG